MTETDPAEPIVDTHLHVWRLADGWYEWNTPALGPVHADAAYSDVQDELTESGVAGAVLVQAADHPAETDRLLGLAAGEPTVLGVVGWLALDDLAGLRRRLSLLPDEPGLVGVRQLWHDHADPAELAGPALLLALEAVGAAGLPVDVPDAFPRLADALTTAVTQLPGTRFVLDHCGKPPFGDTAAWPHWEAWFADLAERQNVVIKLSGLFGGSGSLASATPAELARVVELARTHADPGRIMIGSDWPMTRGRLSYTGSMSRLRRLLADWSTDERRQVLSSTAMEVYRPGARGS